MRASEFLTKLADLMDSAEKLSSSGNEQAEEPATSETNKMVPPLQQKIELLKKAVNVSSIYDDSKEDSASEIGAPQTTNDTTNAAADLEQIKKNAGLAVTLVASEDFPGE